MKLKRIAVGLLKWLLGILLVLVLIHAGFNVAGGLKMRAAKQRLVAAGLPMTWKEILPPPAKDSENAAPLLKCAFDLMQPGWAHTSTNWDQVHSIKQDFDAASKKLQAKAWSPELMDEFIRQMSNAVTRAQAAANTNKLDIPLSYKLTSETVEKRREWYGKLSAEPYASVLRLLREAATEPRCDFHFSFSPENDVDPTATPFLKAGKLLGTHAHLDAEFGQSAAALADVETMLRLAAMLQENPLLIAQLVRISLNAIAIEALRCTLPTRANTPEGVQKLPLLMAELQRNEAWRAKIFPSVVDAERLYGSMMMEKYLKGELGGVEWFPFPESLNPVVPYLLRPWFKLCFADYLDHMAVFRTAGVTPFYQNKDLVERLCSTNNIPRWDLITSTIMAVMPDVTAKFDSDLAALQLARLGLAAELYRQAHGQYPAKLDDLAAFTTIPVDPFTGKAFVYRREGAGFKLYSLGPNQQDDGGVTRAQAKDEDKKKYDIVWDMTSTNAVAEKK